MKTTTVNVMVMIQMDVNGDVFDIELSRLEREE